jgi:hypothetical protein
MLPKRSPFRIFFEKFAPELMGLRADQRGNIAVMMAFLLPVLVGFLGLGFEVSNWYLRTRSMQNAADAAAIAAATNNKSPSYIAEAQAVTALYGFANGINNVQVPPPTIIPQGTGNCPSGGNDCYQVIIISKVPLWLAQVVGYPGDTTINGAKAVTLSSTALALNNTNQQAICLLALATSGTALRTNGAPNSNFAGCTVMSDSASTCNGSNLNANYGLAHATNTGCGNKQDSNIPIVPDPYSYMATNIPKNTCSSYPQEPKKGSLPASNQLTGTLTINTSLTPGSGSFGSYPGQMFCGDVQLTGNTVIKTANNTTGGVIVIENGQLDLNGYTLSTSNGSAVTIVFSGDNSGTYTHTPTDNSSGQGGVLNIQAPSGIVNGVGNPTPFPGMAIYQDPSITQGVDITYKGNNPDYLISGGVYLPNSNVLISGDVSQSTNGADCFVMVSNTIWVDGTSNIYQQTPDGSACTQSGLKIPTATIPGRAKLVY